MRDQPGKRLGGVSMCGVFGEFSSFMWLENWVVGGLGDGEPGTWLEDRLGSDCLGPESSSWSPILQGSGSHGAVAAPAVSASPGSVLTGKYKFSSPVPVLQHQKLSGWGPTTMFGQVLTVIVTHTCPV